MYDVYAILKLFFYFLYKNKNSSYFRTKLLTMEYNYAFVFVAALIPLVIGSVWYHPKVFGTAWAKVADMTEEKMKNANMLVIFGLTYVLSVMAAFIISMLVIHQAHIYSALMSEPSLMEEGSELNLYVKDFMAKYGNNYRTFQHGVFHGFFTGLFLAMPVLAVNALFERKGFKYIAINAGYWMVSFALMGGILCAMM